MKKTGKEKDPHTPPLPPTPEEVLDPNGRYTRATWEGFTDRNKQSSTITEKGK